MRVNSETAVAWAAAAYTALFFRRRSMARIVTAKEVAEFLRLTETTVCKLAASGDLPGFKIGKSWRFDMDEIMERINRAKRQVKRQVA